jgi:hypothetical protein
MNKYHQKYRQRPEAKELARINARKYQRKVRISLLQMYGNKCNLCSESNLNFLDIDHIKGGGRQHSLQCGGNARMYLSILKENYQPDKYRILCKICNQLARWCTDNEVKYIQKARIQFLNRQKI